MRRHEKKTEGPEVDGRELRQALPVPPLNRLKEDDRLKAERFCHAAYNAMVELGGVGVTTKQLGAHNELAMARKDPFFQGQRLTELLERHPLIFEVETDENAKPRQVKLQPNAAIYLPQISARQRAIDSSLPVKIDLPSDPYELCQACRIEIIHILHYAGGVLKLNDIGQAQKVIEWRKSFPPGTQLLEILRAFPGNFGLAEFPGSHGQYEVTLMDSSASDISMIAPFVDYKTSCRLQTRNKRTHTAAFGDGLLHGVGVWPPPQAAAFGNGSLLHLTGGPLM